MKVREAAARPRVTALAVVLAAVCVLVGCTPRGESAAVSSATDPSVPPSIGPAESGPLVVVGRIVTMDEPPIAEALLIQGGTVTMVGTREEVLAAAGESAAMVDIGDNVAYPGFIDAHAHWIGDRESYGLGSAEEAMDAALARGWTSISEQWVDAERLTELEALAAADGLSIRVDAYLALNAPAPSGEHFGDWYADRRPGPVGDRLRVQGVKVTLDNGWGTIFHWEPAELADTMIRASDADWQVSVHTVSAEAHDMVLDAFEAAIGPEGPNPLHHRIDHGIQVTDEQLSRMVAMDLATVIHLDGAAADWVLEAEYLGNLGPDNPGEEVGWLARWRDFVDAGLHVAAASDTPWLFPGFQLTDDIGRPVDQVAGGMDARGRLNPDVPQWALDQLLTAEEGLRGVTVEAAHAIGDASRRGHLAPGALGDVTVLSGDIIGAMPDEIRAMTVIATIVGGTVAYCGDPTICGER